MVRVWDQVLRTHFCFSPHKIARDLLFVCLSFLVVAVFTGTASANPKYSGIVMDAKTGRVLYSNNANSTRFPASLTKMMTLYLTFEALEQGKTTKKSRVRMSKFAASKPPSKLGIKAGRSLSVEQAIYALVTKSANDVAAALAEHLGGSERNFAKRMTNRARQLGMRRTTFRNASGLPAKGQVTTAKDMALLGIALREHYPKYFRYFSTRTFKYGKRKFSNYNRLLGNVKGVDGIKTGYTRASGFNLVSSVRSNKRSIVAVVMGGKSGKSRNAQMRTLISKYLKKATRGKKRSMLVARIARPKSANIQVAGLLKLPKRGPIPVFRAQNNDPARLRIEQAQVAGIGYAPSERTLTKQSIDAIRGKLLAMNSSLAPVPKQSPIANLDTLTTASIRPRAPVGTPAPKIKPVAVAPQPRVAAVQTKIPAEASGWHVQVGAVPDQEMALALLDKARKKLPSLSNAKKFGNLSDYLEPISKNGQTLYRARFAGFYSKKSARSACAAMKKRKISCLAVKG